MKKTVVLYGAFDRYNYGDNLMPILLKMFLQSYHLDKVSDIEFIPASIQASDLTNYKCMPTVAMRDLLNLPKGSSIIVVGGEVLGASVGILYMHVQDNLAKNKILRIIRRLSPKTLNFIAKQNYDAVWEYPYIPNKDSFLNDVKVIYNTVGANPPSSQKSNIESADYISARDARTFNYLSGLCDVKLVPDSVLLASKIVSEEFLLQYVRPSIKSLSKKNYISVQACPYKVDFSPQQLAVELEKTIEACDVDVVLLPIGYASGHDDEIFLNKVKSLSKRDFLLLDDLNVWEIMYVIIKSKAFFGTSLHGVVTAMSFSIPHFSINGKIEKLTSFLNSWSVEPFSKPISFDEITNVFQHALTLDLQPLRSSVAHAQSIIHESLDEISELI